ncbi:MAG: kelch repeat-containing protein [Candidatus Binatus sp.]|uniref:kelch repeat-containing protein n=1 Tax=Candidatus Binatus sp. TaxID=2811406 RepID=UPI003BB08447
MFTFSSARPAVWVLIALLSVTTGLVTYDVATAADLATAHDAKNSSLAGTLKIKPGKHDFGKVIVPLTSASATITVTNNSKSASVDFTTIVAAPPFSIQTDGCTGAPLAAGAMCQLAVVFSPTTTGKVTDKKALTFTDSAKKNPQHVELSGQGIVGATPTATATAMPSPTTSPTPNGSTTPTATATATCTPEEQPTPYIAGLVLITGGQGSDGTPLNSAEVFNPKTNTFTLTTDPTLGGSAMNDSRYRHAADVASDNPNPPATILLSGGIDAVGATSTTETFSSLTNQFAAGNMSVSRQGHTETELLGVHHTHSFLIAGGEDAAGTILRSAEVPPPAMMNVARLNAAESTLQTYSGGVRDTCTASNAVITGGFDGISALQSAEVYNTTLNTFTLTDDPSLGGSQMHAPRMFHTATPLGSGPTDVLITGGENAAGVAQSTAEIFDPSTSKFTLTTDLGGTNMTVARAMHTATRYYFESSVLIAGGVDDSGNVLATAEVFNPATETFTAVGSMHTARFNHAAAALPNGKILITGGEDGSGNTLNTAEIFDPTTNTFTLTTDPSLGGTNMNAARKLHTATPY